MTEKDPPLDSVLSAIVKESDIFEKSRLKDHLIFYINHLLLNDFNKLIQLLYKVDVDEVKLKGYLSEHPDEDAAILIAGMLIARQVQKEKDKISTPPDDSISDEDKW